MNQILSFKATVSEIYRDIGQVFFASLFLGPLFSRGNINWILTIEGFILSLLFWFLSVAMIKQISTDE